MQTVIDDSKKNYHRKHLKLIDFSKRQVREYSNTDPAVLAPNDLRRASRDVAADAAAAKMDRWCRAQDTLRGDESDDEEPRGSSSSLSGKEEEEASEEGDDPWDTSEDEGYGSGWMAGTLWQQEDPPSSVVYSGTAVSGRWLWRGCWTGKGSSRSLFRGWNRSTVLEDATREADGVQDIPGDLEQLVYGLPRHGDPERSARLRKREEWAQKRVLGHHVPPFVGISALTRGRMCRTGFS